MKLVTPTKKWITLIIAALVPIGTTATALGQSGAHFNGWTFLSMLVGAMVAMLTAYIAFPSDTPPSDPIQ